MQIPLQITLHGIRHSDALHDAIRKRAEKLERYDDRIVSCRVVLELSSRHQRHGNPLTVRIALRIPGGEIAVTHEHGEDMRAALRDAFDAAQRRLVERTRKRSRKKARPKPRPKTSRRR